MSKLKIIWNFAIPILCLFFGVTFLWVYFFGEHSNRDWLLYGIMFFIAGAIWFKVLYKGYKLMKAEEKGMLSKETKKTVQANQSQTAESPATRYWKRFMWVVVVLFVLGLIIRYFSGVYKW
ncbi:hypothetical protein KJ934_00175 [Patescibacteria group bacterium]|nr:hypothetical protein [Patescibacteria group bacterium]MBU4353330.1 hypothetical protein [Patescibacteria group bacterium]MBU4476955.1 hypothetical protein [Patescibacteria group bacterium]MCG2699304.1 hypothetical protein [Candidatus Parcubacteria bacterium]